MFATSSAFTWLLRLRWLAVCGQAAVVLFAAEWFALEVISAPVISVVGLTLVSNLLLSLFSKRIRRAEAVTAAVLALDLCLLSVLLHYSGGPENPFSIVYLLHVVLAAVLLGRVSAWVFAAASSLLYALLFFFSTAASSEGMHGGMHAHHAPSAGGFDRHLLGMWVAYVFVAMLTAYCVSRITEALRQMEREAERLRSSQQRLASLTTLAAGAAHELSTPLGTIALAVGQLRRGVGLSADSQVQEDLQLIEDQSARCKQILQQMSIRSAELDAEVPVDLSYAEFCDATRAQLQAWPEVQLRFAEATTAPQLRLPLRPLLQSLGSLIKNAHEAGGDPAAISLDLSLRGEQLELCLRDAGEGMPPEVLSRCGEPFFSTKDIGQGMGLGVFLARLTIERFGGSLQIQSLQGQGTRVHARLPVRAVDTEPSVGDELRIIHGGLRA